MVLSEYLHEMPQKQDYLPEKVIKCAKRCLPGSI